MQRNMGGVDRGIRALIGLALIAWGFLGMEGTGRWIAVGVGLIPLLTALVGFCPLYLPLGISTRKEG